MNIINNRYKVITTIKEDLSNTLYLVSDMINDNKKMAFKIINPELISQKLRTAKEGICNSFFTVPSQSYANLRVWNNKFH